MKTIVFPKGINECNTFPIILDSDSSDVVEMKQARSGVDRVYIAPSACEVKYYEGSQVKILKAEKGDIIVVFSVWHDPKNRIIVVKNKDWKENIAVVEAKEAADRAEEETLSAWDDCCKCCAGCR